MRARWRDLPGLVWTHAAAYGGASVDFFRGVSEQTRTDDVRPIVRALRVAAAVALVPLSFVLVASTHIRGGVYGTRDRRALVIAVQRSRGREMGALLLVAMGSALVVCAVFFLACLWAVWMRSAPLLTAVMLVGNALFWILATWFALGVALLLLPALLSSGATSSIGKDTPQGDRWVVESLAARSAADGAAAFLLAARTLRAFPPGRVLAVGARTNALRDGYERLGFIPLTGNLLYLET